MNKILKRTLVTALAFSVFATSITPPATVNATISATGLGGSGGSGGKATGQPPTSIQGYNVVVVGHKRGLDTSAIIADARSEKRSVPANIAAKNGDRKTKKYWKKNTNGTIFLSDFHVDGVPSNLGKRMQNGVKQGMFYLYNTDVGDHTQGIISGKHGKISNIRNNDKLYVNAKYSYMNDNKPTMVNPESQIKSLSPDNNDLFFGKGLFSKKTGARVPKKKALPDMNKEEDVSTFDFKDKKVTMGMLGEAMYGTKDGNSRATASDVNEARTYYANKMKNKWAVICDLQTWYFSGGGGTPDLGSWCSRAASMLEMQLEGTKRYLSETTGGNASKVLGLYYSMHIDDCKDWKKNYWSKTSGSEKERIEKSVELACKDLAGKHEFEDLYDSFDRVPSVIWRYIYNTSIGSNPTEVGKYIKDKDLTVKQYLSQLREACNTIEGTRDLTDNKFDVGYGSWTLMVTPVMSQQYVGTQKLNLITGAFVAKYLYEDTGSIIGRASHHTWKAWLRACIDISAEGTIKFGTSGYNQGYYTDKISNSGGNKGNDWTQENVNGKHQETNIHNDKKDKVNDGFVLAIVEPMIGIEIPVRTIANGAVTNQIITVNDKLKSVGADVAENNSEMTTSVYMNGIEGNSTEKDENGRVYSFTYPLTINDTKKFEALREKDDDEDDTEENLMKLVNEFTENAYKNGGASVNARLISAGKKSVDKNLIDTDTKSNKIFKSDSYKQKENGTLTQYTDKYKNKINEAGYQGYDYIVADKQSSINKITTTSSKTGSALLQSKENSTSTKYGVTVDTIGKMPSGDFVDGIYLDPPKFTNFANDTLSKVHSTDYLALGAEYKAGVFGDKKKEKEHKTESSTPVTVENFTTSDKKAVELQKSLENASTESLKNVSKDVSSKFSAVYYAPNKANEVVKETNGWVQGTKNFSIQLANSRRASGYTGTSEAKIVTNNYNSTIANTGVLLQRNPTVVSTYSSYYIEMSEDVASDQGVCWYNGLTIGGKRDIDSLTESDVYDIKKMNDKVAGATLKKFDEDEASYVTCLKGGLFDGNKIDANTTYTPVIMDHKLFTGKTLDGQEVHADNTYGTGKTKHWGIKNTVTATGDNMAVSQVEVGDAAMYSNYALLIQRTDNNVEDNIDWSQIITKILRSLNTRKNGDFYNTSNIIVGNSGVSKIKKALSNLGINARVKYLGQGDAESIKSQDLTSGSQIIADSNGNDIAVGYDMVTLTVKKANLPIVTSVHTNPDELNHIYPDILGDRSTNSYSNYNYGGTEAMDKGVEVDSEAGDIKYIGGDPTLSGAYSEKDKKPEVTIDNEKYHYATIATAPKLSMWNVWTDKQANLRWFSVNDKYGDLPYTKSSAVNIFRASMYNYTSLSKTTHRKNSVSQYFKNSKLEDGKGTEGTFGMGNIPASGINKTYAGWNNKGEVSETEKYSNTSNVKGSLTNGRADAKNAGENENGRYLIGSDVIMGDNKGAFAFAEKAFTKPEVDETLVRVVSSHSTPADGSEPHNSEHIRQQLKTKAENGKPTEMMVTALWEATHPSVSGVESIINKSDSASPNNVLVLKKSNDNATGKSTKNSTNYGVLGSTSDEDGDVANFVKADKSVKPKEDFTNQDSRTKNGENADGWETKYTRGSNSRFRWNAIGSNMENKGKGNQLVAYDAEINEQSILDYMVLVKHFTYETMSTLGLIRTTNDKLLNGDGTLKTLNVKSETSDDSYIASNKDNQFYTINNTNNEARNYFVYSKSTGKYLSYYPEVAMKAYALTKGGSVVKADKNADGTIRNEICTTTGGVLNFNDTGNGAEKITMKMIYTVGESKRVFEQKSINIISTDLKSNEFTSATVSDAVAGGTDAKAGNTDKQVIYQGANINLNVGFNKKYLLLSNYTLDLPVSKDASTAVQAGTGTSILPDGDVTYAGEGYTAADILGTGTGGVVNDLHKAWNYTSADNTGEDNVGIEALSREFKNKYFAGKARLSGGNGAATDEQFNKWADELQKAIKSKLTLVVSDGGQVRNVYNNFDAKTAFKVQTSAKENLADVKKKEDGSYYNSYMIVVKDGKILKEPINYINHETGQLTGADDTNKYTVRSDWKQLINDVAEDMGYTVPLSETDFNAVENYVENESGMLKNLKESMITLDSDANHSITKRTDVKYHGNNPSVYRGLRFDANGKVSTGQVYNNIAYHDDEAERSENGYAFKNTAEKWYSESTSVFIVRRSTRRLNLTSITAQDKLDIGSGPSKVNGTDDKNKTLQDYAENEDNTTGAEGINKTWDAKWYMKLYFDGDNMPNSNNFALNGGKTQTEENKDTYLVGNKETAGTNKADSKTWGLHLEGADFLVPDATTSDMRR